MRALRKWFVLLSFALAPMPALGQACGGFSDVTPADFYCNDVEWLKNRQVTLGCVDPPGAYCEDHSVLRSQMAAFMKRLGGVLTPLILRATEVAPTQHSYNPFLVACATPQDDGVPGGVEGVPATMYPRQASFTATIMNFNATSTKTVQGRFVYSTDNGTTWLPTPGDFVMWQTVDPAERTTLALTGGPFSLAVGSPPALYRFAVQLTTNNIAALVDTECQLTVRVDNANGTTSPF